MNEIHDKCTSVERCIPTFEKLSLCHEVDLIVVQGALTF